MVKGLDVFSEFFKDYQDTYLLIGGTACDLILEEADLVPRVTRDLDIILIVEALTPDFVKRFWEFIDAGGYAKKEKNEEHRTFFRFTKPSDVKYPTQIELFSREPDMLQLDEGVNLTPIPVDDDILSLSAILLDEDYYSFTLGNVEKKGNINRANTQALICLKARAFLDLSKRKAKGEKIDSKDINKHKTDVFRLGLLLPADVQFKLPASILKDMKEFMGVIEPELPGKELFRSMRAGDIDSVDLFNQLNQNLGLTE